MNDGDSVRKHLSVFNNVISELLSIEIKITKEEKCSSLLFSLPKYWDSLVVAIRSNNTTLKLNDVVTTLLSKQIR